MVAIIVGYSLTWNWYSVDLNILQPDDLLPPDTFLGENSASWTAEGRKQDMLDAFKDFPPQARRLLT